MEEIQTIENLDWNALIPYIIGIVGVGSGGGIVAIAKNVFGKVKQEVAEIKKMQATLAESQKIGLKNSETNTQQTKLLIGMACKQIYDMSHNP